MVKPTFEGHKVREADRLFCEADHKLQQGNNGAAFQMFLLGAKAGDPSSQLNVGYFYDRGIGVRQNKKTAILWYTRAYRRGDAAAANNIGTIWRARGELRRALSWFRRALKMGDDGANLSIAKLYVRRDRNSNRAVACLEQVCRSNRVTEVDAEEAARLLKKLKKRRS